MADEGVDIRVRTTGTRRSASEVDHVAAKLRTMGRSGKLAATGLKASGRASTAAAAGMRRAGSAALYGAAAVGGSLVYELKRSVDAWEEKRKIVAQTGAVLRSTGGEANVTARDVDRLSTALSRKSGMDDEAIRDAQNLLLTFRDIHNEVGTGRNVFTRATKATVDLAAGMHMGLRPAALQVGKALNDPERGFKRLQRIGVVFNKTQEDQITRFSESGQRAKAQGVILRELGKEFGGSAGAQMTALDRLKVSWGNVEEAIGKGVSPAVDSLAGTVDRALVKAEPKIDAFGNRIGAIFDRKDLSLADKLDLAGQDLSRTTRPLRHEIERELGHLNLGGKLADAFDAAAPRIADAAGRAAPKAAGAFVHAFLNAGPYGQLFTVALLSSKLGAFGAIGRLAARRFTRSWRRNVSLPTPTPGVPTSGGGAGGGRSRLSRLGRTIGGIAVVGDVAAAGYAVGHELVGPAIAKPLHLGPYSDSAKRADEIRARARRGQLTVSGPGAHYALDPPRRRAHASTVAARPSHIVVQVDGEDVAHKIVTRHGKTVERGVSRVRADREARR